MFTGAATAEIPIIVPPGTAGAAPKIRLRYSSVTVDELGPRDQGQWTGLGWTLDAGGFILRDTKNTTELSDDTFRLVFGGTTHDLVLVDGSQNYYHTKDETFWRLQYNASADQWTLWTKDGTQHHFGYASGSKAITRGQDLVTPITYKYMLDEVITTSGTSVIYAYSKQTGSVPASGQSYEQAIYPETITYTYHNGSPVGPAREVRFLRASRSDWTDTSASTNVSFFERDRLDSVEIRVGTSLVRRYSFSYDYSIDRDPGYTWGGGATGDLTLRSVTQIGTDGASALPSLTFGYSGPHLGNVNNGIGGTVSYTYDRLTTTPIYSAFKYIDQDNCRDYGVGNDTGVPGCEQHVTLVGHAVTTNRADTTPLYSAFKFIDQDNCRDFGVSNDTGVPGCQQHASLVGYALTTNPSGTIPLYSAYKYLEQDNCADLGASNTTGVSGCEQHASLVGYVYVARVDRARVTARSVSDGRGQTSTMTFSYPEFALSSDGKEFRGHAWVRAVDPAGHYTDTWFKQDDALRGRAYQVETRRSDGALYAKVVNTWSAQGIWPGATFASLDRTDVYTCDGDASCKQTAQTFQYDLYGNALQVQHLGDLSVSGDERTEVTEYAANAEAYIVGLPAHTSTLDATGATVAQTWFYYDGATSHTTPPTAGRLTRRCRWLSGGSNPCVTLAYDIYGNVTATTDARGNTTTTAYDATYRTFPMTVTTPPTPNVPSGLVTTSTHDERFGVVLTTTDPNGQTTTSQYDLFGRLVSVTNPLNETRTISYDALGSVGSQRITTRLPDGSPNGLWTEEYFDGLGRTFKVRKRAAAGQVILSETNFDVRGLVSQKSLPRFEGTSPVWTTLAYDPIARPTQTTFPDGTTETLGYSDWTVTFTDRNGRIRTTVKDAYGRTVQVTEPGGAVTRYAYDVLGRLTSVTDAAGNVTSMIYDTLGRKIQMIEPNMGTWSYGYDPDGNLISQTDAKGQILLFAYDALNRLTTKTYPGPVLVPLSGGVLSWPEGYAGLYRGGVCVADATGACIGGDVRVEAGLGPLLGYMNKTEVPGTVPLYQGLCYTNPTGACIGWGLSLEPNGAPVGYLATTAPDQQSANAPFVPSGGLLYQGLEYTPPDLVLVPLTRGAKSWFSGYTPVYRGGVCVADGAGACIGGDVRGEAGPTPAIGHIKNTPDAGTTPLYRSLCYSNATGSCTGWGLSLDTNGSAVGYLSQTAPDQQSQNTPLTQSGGLLYQGLEPTPSGLVLVPLVPAVKSWSSSSGAMAVYRGGVCVADASGSCVGGDVRTEAGLGSAIGYAKGIPDHSCPN
jgi:YD repeat-containing protein